jgi:hypothetical protein
MSERQWLETKRVNNRVNLYSPDAILPGHPAAAPLSKGRSAAEEFAHIHWNRGMR